MHELIGERRGDVEFRAEDRRGHEDNSQENICAGYFILHGDIATKWTQVSLSEYCLPRLAGSVTSLSAGQQRQANRLDLSLRRQTLYSSGNDVENPQI